MIYLAGKMTDTTEGKEAANKLRFFQKATELRELGVDVYNPAQHEPPNKTWENYLANDLEAIFRKNWGRYLITGAYFMKGWEDSKGAKLEMEACKTRQATDTSFLIIEEQ
jgi:hypothetical protein